MQGNASRRAWPTLGPTFKRCFGHTTAGFGSIWHADCASVHVHRVGFKGVYSTTMMVHSTYAHGAQAPSRSSFFHWGRPWSIASEAARAHATLLFLIFGVPLFELDCPAF